MMGYLLEAHMRWNDKIEEAATPADLLSLARDYIAEWAAPDLALVPEQARPLRVKGIDDLAYWHQRLVDCYCTGAAVGAGGDKVRDMLQFFALAIQRAAELEGEPGVGDLAAARLFSERSVPRLFTSAMTGASER
jgi:hypothetical protein